MRKEMETQCLFFYFIILFYLFMYFFYLDFLFFQGMSLICPHAYWWWTIVNFDDDYLTMEKETNISIIVASYVDPVTPQRSSGNIVFWTRFFFHPVSLRYITR